MCGLAQDCKSLQGLSDLRQQAFCLKTSRCDHGCRRRSPFWLFASRTCCEDLGALVGGVRVQFGVLIGQLSHHGEMTRNVEFADSARELGCV